MDLEGGVDVIAFRIEGGGVVAYDAACPHAGALLRPENEMGGILVCYLHQWRFDVTNGDCIDVPRCPLKRYPVKVQGFDVTISLDGGGEPSSPHDNEVDGDDDVG